MDNEVRVRMCNCNQHIEEEAESRLHVEHAFVTVPVDVVAFDIFEYEIGLAGRRNTRIHQLRDVSMGKSAEYAALALKAILAPATDQCAAQALHRPLPLESPVAAL